MGLFSKWKKSDDNGDTAAAAASAARDPKKARRFFEHAQAVADSRNYDYAIECYINGLRHDPESMQHHEALRDVALRRKVNGGKAASLKEQFSHSGGKTAIDKMLNAEFLWAKDPFNAQLALSAMEGAAKAELPEVTYWIGGFVLENGRAAKKPSKSLFIKARDLFEKIGAYDQAVEACKGAVSLDPGNGDLMNDLKNLEAELTLMVGKYGEGSFHTAVKDSDKQRALDQEDSVARTESAQEETVARAKAAYEENPEDMDLLGKLVRVLVQSEREEAENEAIEYLKHAYEKTGQSRYKIQIGDLRMKQYARRVRQLKQAASKADDEQKKAKLVEQLKQTVAEQLKFELKEFTERAKAYPTDMGIRFNLGRRQFAVGDYDAAIASFQEAQSDPKSRPWALRYLGESFARKEWYDEAVDTFHRGIEVHPYSDDRLALELRYELMKVLELKGDRDEDLAAAQEASKVASQIAQADINYKDIRDRINHIREIVNRLKKAQA